MDCFSHGQLYVACSRVVLNLTIYLYAQTMGQRRMLYIRKFYKHIYISIYIHRWDTGTQLQWRVTNMTRKKLKKEKNLKEKT